MTNIWFCGVPGSKWSGVDILLNMLPCDRTDETPIEYPITELIDQVIRIMDTAALIGDLVWVAVNIGQT